MSILSSFFHGETNDLPNDVHGAANDDTKIYEGRASLTQNAQRRRDAMAQADVRPAMSYSEEELIPGDNGAWATPHTVESQLEQREEMPRG